MILTRNLHFCTFLQFSGGCSVSPCSPGVICRNIGLGGYKCEGCLPGYTNNTDGKCIDVNEVCFAYYFCLYYNYNRVTYPVYLDNFFLH